MKKIWFLKMIMKNFALFSAFKATSISEQSKPTAKDDLIDFDAWSSDMLNKPKDKTAIVKQGIQTLVRKNI